MNRSFPSVCLLLLALLIAFISSCVKLPRRLSVAGDKASVALVTADGAGQTRISINRATRAELEKLPGIGMALAGRIVEHRERYGAFRRPEHLIIVRGISERRFRQMRAFISIE